MIPKEYADQYWADVDAELAHWFDPVEEIRKYPLFVEIDGEMVKCGVIRVKADGTSLPEVCTHDANVVVEPGDEGYELKKLR